MILVDENGLFRMNKNKELTPEILREFIAYNEQMAEERYQPLIDAYRNKYEIFKLPKKQDGKPDNRVAVNFAKYITDTMNGFFIGNPIKISTDDADVKAYVEMENAYNMQDDKDAELSKQADIFGKGYEMYYVDDDGHICTVNNTPLEAFMIYDDSVVPEPLYFVRYYKDADNKTVGSFSSRTHIRYFEKDSSIKFLDEEKPHGFQYVPASEVVENEERIGLFESAMSLMNAFNKALSEKANDVDYFADAYMKIIGPSVDESVSANLRKDRIVNIPTENPAGIVCDFMEKPNADTTQENLIDRLEKLIFTTTMVANINDENFGTTSGIALRYRLQSMSNLANVKKRKFTALLNNRYKIIFSNPVSTVNRNDWMKLRFDFSFNYPANLAEEVDIASKMVGITSEETRLSIISAVDDVAEEKRKMQTEQDKTSYMTDYPTERTESGLLEQAED